MSTAQRSFFDDDFDRDMAIERSGNDEQWLADKQHVVRRTDEESKQDLTVASRVLARLQIGPATTMELIELVGHRFSCGVEHLRNTEGFEILVEKLEHSGRLYTLIGKRDLVKVTEELKEAYYCSSHWQQTRLRRIEFDGGKCVRCHATEKLEVHHWMYSLFAEDIGDLETLCRTCHEWIHSLNCVRATFPKLITEEMERRLK